MPPPTPAPYHPSPTGKHCVQYSTSWGVYARNFNVADLSIDKITDVSYAFMNLDATGTVFSGDPEADAKNLGAFDALRKKGKKFNLTLAVGGWSWSGRFSEAVSTAKTRETFVTTLTEIIQKWPGLFCGVSIDWEYISTDSVNYGLAGNTARPEDGVNLVRLLKLIRKKLPGFRVGMCVTAAPEKIKMPVDKIHPLVDTLDIMTYDMMDGAWGPGLAGHHTNLRRREGCPYSVEDAVEAWLARGVPASKIFIGAAFYSRGFSGTAGLLKQSNGGSPDTSWEPGVCDYKALPRPGAKELWDPIAQAEYSYDSKKKVLNSYDGPRSVLAKCKFIHDKGLGGLIVWEASGDHPYDHPRSLTRVIHDNLTHGGGAKAPTPQPPKPTPQPPKPTTPPTAPQPPKPQRTCDCPCPVHP